MKQTFATRYIISDIVLFGKHFFVFAHLSFDKPPRWGACDFAVPGYGFAPQYGLHWPAAQLETVVGRDFAYAVQLRLVDAVFRIHIHDRDVRVRARQERSLRAKAQAASSVSIISAPLARRSLVISSGIFSAFGEQKIILFPYICMR